MMKKQKVEFNKHNLKWLISLFLLILALAIPGYIWMKKTNHDRVQRGKALLSPIVMVPGSSATVERFNSLIEILNKNTQQPHSVLKIEVMENGTLKYQGSINRADNEPIIVVGFEDNRDGYSNIKKQANWLNIAFKQISQSYKFNNFKAFGHSNGGLVWTYWLEHYYSSYYPEIKIKKLMTLASPFNFNESHLSHRTQMLNDFIKYKNKLPRNLKVYALTGGQTYESDGIVPETSVEASKYIFQDQVKSFIDITVTGKQANHSALPQNKQIVKIMREYLLDKPKTAPTVTKKKKTK